ncbi:MAG: 3-phosphoshikimate 1-carboxyvinyltransferase [Clostridia bacterium]|nr:3-phosphoshikimate 1-carboxyvinyltransferase [Clostridia bacterium]
MRVKIEKGIASGSITAPPSKSISHRLLIAAALAEGESIIRSVSDCEDVIATMECLGALGVECYRVGNDVIVNGKAACDMIPTQPLFARESGSTLRFLIPIALSTGKATVFRGAEGLMKRPMTVYEELAREKNFTYINDGNSIIVNGKLRGGEYTLAGNVSSQFISGLLFALPTARSDSYIKILPPIESRSYIELTMSALRKFGIKTEWIDENTIYVPKNQRYVPCDVTVEGDYSGAAFPAAFNLFGGKVEIGGLFEDSLQGDSVFMKYYDMLRRGVPTIHIGDCPDLGPIMFAIAAAKNGGIFTGTKRLKIKESDRAAAMAEELKKFGTNVSVYDDTVVIYPASFKAPEEALMGHNDHRIIMSLSVLCTLVGGEILGAEAVSKSYPAFFTDMRALGISVEEYDD